MNIVIAPDSFKGSLSSNEVGQTIYAAFRQELPHAHIAVVPMADGGEGTVEAILSARKGEKIFLEATGPYGIKQQTYYGGVYDPSTAVIEAAAVVGLADVPVTKREPLLSTTLGLGECVIDALSRGFHRIIIGLGGSATNDGGIGLLHSLGVRFFDAAQQPLPPIAESLSRVHTADFQGLHPLIKETEIIIACDVDNPLCGPDGATYVFGPQKGVTPLQLNMLDNAMKQYADCVEKQLGTSYQHCRGAGAAGGLGFAILTLGGKIVSGASLVAEAVQLEERIKEADIVITGEGKSDSQTLHGKVPFFVARLAKPYRAMTILLSGSLDTPVEPLYEHFDSMHAIINKPMSLDECISQAERLLFERARNIARLIKCMELPS